MTKFNMEFNWLDFGQHDAAEINATFAEFKITVGGHPITRVLDTRARTTREYIRVPLYPLAEWLVFNWWRLFYEVKTPGKKASDLDQETLHCFSAAQEGFPLPQLAIYSEGDTANLRWTAYAGAFHNVEFLESGGADVPKDDIKGEASALVRAVLDRLAETGVKTPILLENWQAIENSDEDEAEFCRAAAYLGLDPYALRQQDAAAMMDIWRQIPEGVRADAFTAANMDNLPQLATWIQQGIDRLGPNVRKPSQFVGRLQRPLITHVVSPWEEGYILAQHARRELGIAPLGQPDLSKFGWRQVRASAPSSTIDGLIGLEVDAITCYSNKERPESLRFLAARSMLGWLYGANSCLSLLTSAITLRQQQERAFAAEFLVPAQAIKSRIAFDEVTEDQIADIAAEFQVSPFVVDHQIKNHRRASFHL
jgi:hypothetical protein